MASFCRYCGSALNRDGRCPKCTPSAYPRPGGTGFSNPLPPKPAKPQKKRRFEVYLTVIAAILALILIATAVLATLTYYNVLHIPFFDDIFVSRGMKAPQTQAVTEPQEDPSGDETVPAENAELSNPGSYDVTPPDADKYFEENSTIISDFDAAGSQDVHSEADTYSNLIDRGFKQFPITTEYSIEGEYSKASEISRSSKTAHPMYQTYYITESGDLWVIAEVNGSIIANPLFYNAESSLDAPVMLSETNTITTYDSTKNKFYVIVPNDSAIIVKTVTRIDAETLEGLTKGEIDKL